MSAPRTPIREAAYTIGFMMVTTFLCVGTVAFAYQIGKERIRLQQDLFERRAVLEAAAIPIPETDEAILRLYQGTVSEIRDSKSSSITRYAMANGGTVFPMRGTGLWGTIKGMVGLGPDSRLTGVSFTEHNETPGLGARIDEAWFRLQFAGKRGPMTMVPEKQPSSETEFDAITGATITSTAVRDMINAVLSGRNKSCMFESVVSPGSQQH
jgi:Na+-transporting NADH:ubiquinone oxidoreductase subunit C